MVRGLRRLGRGEYKGGIGTAWYTQWRLMAAAEGGMNVEGQRVKVTMLISAD